MGIDSHKIRQEFPIYKNLSKPFVFLDNASTTQTPQIVIDAITDYYKKYNANVHRGIYKIGEIATAKYEGVRDTVAQFINSSDKRSIVFTRGTTESINLVAHGWGETNLKPGDEILITEMEHHSNNVPWQMIAKKTGAILKYIPITLEGNLDFEHLDFLLTSKTKIVAMIHQSNVFGTINPIKSIIDKAHNVGALVLIDGAQSTPHISIDVQALDCDFFTFSSHKMCGPTGAGVLYAKPEILESMEPFMGGGEMISTVSMSDATWNTIPWKFEAGTPNIAQVIGMGKAVEYLQSIEMSKIVEHEHQLLEYATQKMLEISGLTIYGNSPPKGAVISFNIEGIHPHDMAHILGQFGVAIRAGHHCAQPIMSKLQISATNRASFYIYNTKEDIDIFIDSIRQARALFGLK